MVKHKLIIGFIASTLLHLYMYLKLKFVFLSVRSISQTHHHKLKWYLLETKDSSSKTMIFSNPCHYNIGHVEYWGVKENPSHTHELSQETRCMSPCWYPWFKNLGYKSIFKSGEHAWFIEITGYWYLCVFALPRLFITTHMKLDLNNLLNKLCYFLVSI